MFRLPPLARCVFYALAVWFGVVAPLRADTPAAPAPAAPESFPQYLVDHQDILGPFFKQHAGEFFRQGVPVAIGIMGWVVVATMLLGWLVDVLMSRGYAFLYAPAFADWKRSLIYASGRLFLSFVYTALMALAAILVLSLPHAIIWMGLALLILGVVALAAQIVWILYLFRTDFGISVVFFLVVLVVNAIAGALIVTPILGTRASSAMTNYIDGAVTSRLQTAAQATRQDLAKVSTGRDSAQARVEESQGQIAQAATDAEHLTRAIDEKKNSDIYTFAQIIKARARGELEPAREQLLAFPTQFPTSPLNPLARTQAAEIAQQLSQQQTQHRQMEADEARATAAARADLLARASRGAVTLSEMRQALVGKSRAEVSNLFGQPSQTGPDSWSYRQPMIFNPIANEHTGLTVFFSLGKVQGVDYNRSNL